MPLHVRPQLSGNSATESFVGATTQGMMACDVFVNEAFQLIMLVNDVISFNKSIRPT